MKKLSFLLVGAIMMSNFAFAQPVSDRAVIPVAITLNQILRLSVTDGGNIEFVFNTITDYETGLSSTDPQYQTYFNVASSTPWTLQMYAEENSMTGTDDPTQQIALNNFGFVITNNGGNHALGAAETINFTAAGISAESAAASAQVLTDAAVDILGCSALSGVSNCAGDISDNSMVIYWEAGTGRGDMNSTSFINLGVRPDRYVVNTYLDLRTSNI